MGERCRVRMVKQKQWKWNVEIEDGAISKHAINSSYSKVRYSPTIHKVTTDQSDTYIK